MIEPWNIKTDNERDVDSLPTFIIFCEDGEIEPEYFTFFSSSKIQISTIRNCKKHHQQVDYATDYCRANDLIELQDEKECLKLDEGAQVWCVFDRDKEENDGKDTSFTDAITTAESKGMRVAWSNDDFELWILLHFEDVDPNDPAYKNRGKYYERLTIILSNLPPFNAKEERLTRNAKFDYYDWMKKRNRFIDITYQHMKGLTTTAIERAEKLEKFHSNPPKPYHEQVPCTKVHYLVNELVRLGGRNI